MRSTAPVLLVTLASLAACTGSQPRPAGTAGAVPRPAPVAASTQREAALEALAGLASHPRADVRANAVEAIARVPSRATDIVRGALADDNTGVRTVAALVVGKEDLCTLTGRCRVALGRATSSQERMAAIFALRSCGEDADPTPLAGELLTASDARVRAHAAYILGELGDRSAVPLLREASVAPAGAAPGAIVLLRLQIAEALVKLGQTEELSVLRAALYPARPADLEAAALAAQIIGEVRDREAITQLVYLTASGDDVERPMPAEVRLAATGALAQLGVQDGSFVAMEYVSNEREAIRAQAATVLGQTRRRSNLAQVSAMLEDESPIVRVAAAAAILRITGR